MGFPELKNIISGALEYLDVTLGNVFNSIIHKDRFTISTAYKAGFISPILAAKIYVYAYINSFCFANSYAGEGLFLLSPFVCFS